MHAQSLTQSGIYLQIWANREYYFSIRFKDREQCVMLSQLRLWDGKRLTHKMGQLPDEQFEAVKQALRRLLK
jgi:mRNA-degrading endonuclease toxin of MazEF toxin-antitoxin module